MTKNKNNNRSKNKNDIQIIQDEIFVLNFRKVKMK